MYFAGPDPHTFNLLELTAYAQAGGFGQTFQLIVFGAVALGLAVKVPMWPLHTWLPDAHTEAPTIGSVLLAGVMLKMGTYGFIRIAIPTLPDAAREYAPWIGLLAAIAIVYAALACLAQRDLKRLIAFSSVGHMGFVMLGIATLTEIGFQAALFGMIAHGIITGMLFFCVGSIYDRYHTREIAAIGGGMGQAMPKLAGVFAFVAIASLGLPGLAGFWGEVMALLSSFQPERRPVHGAVPRVHDHGRHRDGPHRGLLPVDAPAREHGDPAREVEGERVQRHPQGRVAGLDPVARPRRGAGAVPRDRSST